MKLYLQKRMKIKTGLYMKKENKEMMLMEREREREDEEGVLRSGSSGGEDGDFGAATLHGRGEEGGGGRREVAQLVLARLLRHRKRARGLIRVHVMILHIRGRTHRIQPHPTSS